MIPSESKDNEAKPVVCCRRVRFAYAQDWVLEDADFDIFPGESIAIIGPNGGGKTTLLRLILGRLTPGAGTIEVFGKDARAVSAAIGYVPQRLQLDRLFPVTVLDVVGMGRLHRRSFGLAYRAEREAARAALAQVGLADLEKRPFAHLSGGQQQGVLLARALVSEPKMLVLDEPTTHIDQRATERLQEIIGSLTGTMTVLTVSHDLNFVSHHVGRVLCVNRRVRIHPVKAVEGSLPEHLSSLSRQVVQHEVEEVTRHEHGPNCEGPRPGPKRGETDG